MISLRRSVVAAAIFAIFATVSLAATLPEGSASTVRATQSLLRTGPADFDYDPKSSIGPAHWGDIKADYLKCRTGQLQSSFDIDTRNFSTSAGPKIALKYSKLQYEPTPHNFEFKCMSDKCGSITHAGKTYSLEQVHFHHTSEHFLDGKSYPMEGHFVFAAPDHSKAVLAVFFKRGKANNEVDALLSAANHRSHRNVDLHNFFRRSPRVCVTMGSLTTPPCTENVTWFISKKILTVSRREIKRFADMEGHKKNNRPLQAANSREVMCYKAN